MDIIILTLLSFAPLFLVAIFFGTKKYYARKPFYITSVLLLGITYKFVIRCISIEYASPDLLLDAYMGTVAIGNCINGIGWFLLGALSVSVLDGLEDTDLEKPKRKRGKDKEIKSPDEEMESFKALRDLF